MKVISGWATLFVGIIVAVLGFDKTNYFLIAVGLIVIYTGYRVLKSS